MNNLRLVLIGMRTFAGKLSLDQKVLQDAVELTLMGNGKGGLAITGMLWGDLTIPPDAVISTMSKSSGYYQPYFHTTSNIGAPL